MAEETPQLFNLTPDTLLTAVTNGIPVTVRLGDMAEYLDSTAPAPAPAPQPAPTVLPWDRMASSPDLIVVDTEIPPGQRYAYVKVATSAPPEATAYLDYSVRNVSGGGINVGGGDTKKRYYPSHLTVWHPGDDAEHWITFDLQYGRNVGNAIEIILKPKGFSSDAGVIKKITVVDGAVNELPATMPNHRAPRRLALAAATTAMDLDIPNMKWSDTGYEGNAASGTPCWRSRLAHGYTQHGNGEMGAYLNTDKFPDDAVNLHSVETDAQGRPVLRLHTRRLNAPVYTDATSAYSFHASVIQGQRMDEWCARRGLFRAQMVTPDRHGAWSAFWAIGRTPDGKDHWPPEIDFFEHFNGAWGNDWLMDETATSSVQHVGVFSSGSRKRVNGMTMSLTRLGFSDIDLYHEIHDYACLIEDDYITHFVDGNETLCHRNMTDYQDGYANWAFFPILNVAVKPQSSSDLYDQGSGDMLIYGLQRYDAGWQLVDHVDAKPWPNKKL